MSSITMFLLEIMLIICVGCLTTIGVLATVYGIHYVLEELGYIGR